MVKGYKEFLMILERNNIKKIQKFANIPEIYNWAHELDNNLSVWIADQMVKLIRNTITNGSGLDNDDVEKYNHYLDLYLKGELTKDNVKAYLNKTMPKANNVEQREKDLINLVDDNVNSFKEDFTFFFSQNKQRHNSQFTKVLHYVNSPIHDNRPNIRNLNFPEAVQLSKEWHEEQQKKVGSIIEDEDGDILLNFPDGYYWIDLQSTTCKLEAEAMGHCGNTTKGTTILSLRKNKQPYVTVAYDENNSIFTQIKGKGNTKPIDKYHTYIVDLIIDLDIDKFKSEYQRTSDFLPEDLSPELYAKLEEENPDYIENSKGLSEEELRKKYNDVILENLPHYATENPRYFFNHIDDDSFIESIIKNDVDQSSMEDMVDYYQDKDDIEELREWLIEDLGEDKLRKFINTYITNELEAKEKDKNYPITDGDVKELKQKLEDNNEEYINDLMDRENWKTQTELFSIIDHFDKEQAFYQYYWNKRYGDYDAQEYYENMHGSVESHGLDKKFTEYVVDYMDAFDDEAFAKELSDDEQLDYLEDNYNE